MPLLPRISAYLFVLLLFWSSFGVAQQVDTGYTVFTWQKFKRIVVDGKERQILSFHKALHVPENSFLPASIHSHSGTHLSKVELVDAVWEELSATELKYLPPTDIPNTVQVKVYNGLERKRPVASIEILPLQRNRSTGKIEKLIKFKCAYYLKDALTESQGTKGSQRLESISNSVLSQGEWYKLRFDKSGIYKIDYQYVKSMGLNPSQINPRHLQVWTNGGGQLPEPCDENRAVDLSQTPIYVSGEEDGQFDPQDFILLYVQGPQVWKRNASEPFFRSINNLYSDYSYVFLREGNEEGKRIVKSEVQGSPDHTVNTTQARYVHEANDLNFLSSGRKWYGDAMDNNSSKNFIYRTSGIDPKSKIYIQSALMNKSSSAFSVKGLFTISLNGQNVNSYAIGGSESGAYAPLGIDLEAIDSIEAGPFETAAQLVLNYNYKRPTQGIGTGYLNFFIINFTEKLVQHTSSIDFRNQSSLHHNITEYIISKNTKNSDIRVWDISSLSSIEEPFVFNTSSDATFKSQSSGSLHEFIAFQGTDFPNPLGVIKIDNQNIRGSSTPDLLIVTFPDFLVQANKLADIRRQNDKLDVLVVSTEQLYNEFSSGSQDLVAIRDCSRMFYKRPDGDKFKYLLLFGDCSYDYKASQGGVPLTSLVPVYESENSLHPINSYSSDDYIGMLDDDEGRWDYDDKMDIGIGRFPVKNKAEADAILSKHINYSQNPTTLGAWRQNITFVADDDDESTGSLINIFLENAEELTGRIKQLSPQATMKKVYVGAYPKEATPSAKTAPGALKDVSSSINEGTLILDYIGHGNTLQLASESVINIPLIQSLSNKDKLPFLLTATCEFGKYDDPLIVSGGEQFFLRPNGGAIGLLTTTRPVYQSSNEALNDAFFHSLFINTNGSYQRIGDVQRQTKNASINFTYNRNFALLGDPSLRLAIPQNKIEITKLNGHDFVPFADTIKAQGKVTLTGRIIDNAGNKIPDFNGVINVISYDKDVQANTLEEEQAQFYVQKNKIFNGSATVKNGEFTLSYIIPKTINYNVGLGRISLYANEENGSNRDASGSNSSIYVGSSEKNAPLDNTPPKVQIFLNDESFIAGGATNENPVLLVKISDESGISAVGGIGRSIRAVINENVKNEIILDSYFKSDRDTYKSGTIRYQLTNLQQGINSIRIKVFDTDTNSTTASVDFVVAKHEALSISRVLNYPNPFTTNTAFHFDHNRAGDNLEVLVQVFTIAGRLVKTLSASSPAAASHFSDIHWDGKDDFGDNIGRGVYVYKVTVKASSDGAKMEEYQKLVILN